LHASSKFLLRSGNRIERCLSYDEKPLLLFQKLKDAKKNPVFMLKHIKDIRSPIAVAQQKQAARRASSDTPSTGQSRTSASSDSNRPSNLRPPKLQIHGHNTPAPLLSGASEKPGWPDVMTPSIESKERQDEFVSTVTTGATAHSVDHSADTNANTTQREPVAPGAGLSYAVAIYPYMAEQEDEFDVIV
jgi:bZIP factor